MKCGIVVRIADVRYTGQPDRGTMPMSRDEFAHCDFKLDQIGVGVGNANVRTRRKIRWISGVMGGTIADGNYQPTNKKVSN